MKRVRDRLPGLVFAVLASVTAGCASVSTVEGKIQHIKARHGVTVGADNPLSRCYLFGDLPGLLDRIDEDLERSPEFFKRNIGPVCVEESFADRPVTYPFPFLIRGYVSGLEKDQRFPIHIKNRSLLEKALIFAPRDGELFLHEAAHSFMANVMEAMPEQSRRDLEDEWRSVQGLPYLPRYVGLLSYALAGGLFPPLNYLRVPSRASMYGLVSEGEDFAETVCYLRRHNDDVGFLNEGFFKDPALYKKCKLVQRICSGQL